jgi:hypothetical protein
LREISRILCVSYGSVRQICAHYDEFGLEGIDTQYQHCGVVIRDSVSQSIYDKALSLRKAHEGWGSDRIHVELVAAYGVAAPTVRTLQRWYCKERYSEPKMKHNEPNIGKSQAVHNIWQVDAKEQITLTDQQVACYLTFTDEFSGIWLGSVVFPYHRINQVPLNEVQAACINLFERWGKAGSLRVDNGEPLGNPKMNATPALALWLIAMDVDMIWNKPYTPTQNAKVERMQGTSSRWVEIHNCTDIRMLQARLDAEAIVQRTKLIVRRLNNQTRSAAFPEIQTSRRVFDSTTFDVQRVYRFLATKTYIRKVSANGVLAFYGQKFNIGLKNKSRMVEIKLNIATISWDFYDNQTLVATKHATHLSEENVRNLSVYTPIQIVK